MKNLTKKRPAFNWTAFLVLLLILEFVIFGGTNAKFLKPALLMTSANDFLPICIISIFVTFVMITGGIDIQVASIIGLTSIIIGVAWQDFGLNIWAAVLVAILVAAAGDGRHAGREFPLFGACPACFNAFQHRKLSGYQRFSRILPLDYEI